MAMNEILLEAMGNIDPELVRAARTMGIRKRRNTGRRVFTIVLAAVLMLTLATTAFAYFTGADWFKNWFAQRAGSELTPEQAEFVEERTVDIDQSVTQNGWTVTLESAIATQNKAYIRLTVTPPSTGVPDGVDLADLSLEFDEIKLTSAGPDIPHDELYGWGHSQGWNMDSDGKLSMDSEGRLTVVLDFYMNTAPGSTASYTDGYERTLTLKDLRWTDLSAEPPSDGENMIWDGDEWSFPTGVLAEGEWTFSFTFVSSDEETAELISQPVLCQGVLEGWKLDEEGNYLGDVIEAVDVQMTSFRLTAMGATCEYESNEYAALDFPDVYVVMKNGESVYAQQRGGSAHIEGGGVGIFEFNAPIDLFEVDYIQLPNGYIIPMPELTN